MNELKIFNNPAFGEIRVMTIDGEPWFVAADVCKALEIKNSRDALARLDDDEKGVVSTDTPGGKQAMNAVNEPGLYGLVLASRKKEAKAFKRWIKHEVLPSIRKTGGYIAGQETMTDAELLSKAFIVATKTIEQRNARILSLESDKAALQAQIEADAPRVMWAKVAEGSKDGMLIREFVKFLRPLGVVIGEKRMFADLREKGYLIKAEGRDHNKPTQKAMELGLFTVKERLVSTSDGETKLVTTPLLTEKGKQYFTKMYLAKNALTVNAAASV